MKNKNWASFIGKMAIRACATVGNVVQNVVESTVKGARDEIKNQNKRK